MRLKTYQTETVEAAVRLAGIELGSNAVFLGSRKNDVGDDRAARYDVTFAVPNSDPGMDEKVQQPQVGPSAPGGKPLSSHSPSVGPRSDPQAAEDVSAASTKVATGAGTAPRLEPTSPPPPERNPIESTGRSSSPSGFASTSPTALGSLKPRRKPIRPATSTAA